MHILGVTQRPVEAPSSPFGGARSPDSVPIPLFQTVSVGNSVHRGNRAVTTLLYVGESFLAGSWACTEIISLQSLG